MVISFKFHKYTPILKNIRASRSTCLHLAKICQGIAASSDSYATVDTKWKLARLVSHERMIFSLGIRFSLEWAVSMSVRLCPSLTCMVLYAALLPYCVIRLIHVHELSCAKANTSQMWLGWGRGVSRDYQTNKRGCSHTLEITSVIFCPQPFRMVWRL